MLCRAEAQIGRVLAHCRSRDRAEHNRIAFLLGGADITPRTLAPGSILVVRSLADPLPHAFREPGSNLGANPEWERAAQHSLARATREASRPRRGYIPRNAEAVLFADEAELLACLALDLARGQAAAHWWWHVVRRSVPPTLALLLAAHASLIPAAFDALDDWAAGEIVTRALTSAEIHAVILQVARAFGAAQLAEELTTHPSSWTAAVTTPPRVSASHTTAPVPRTVDRPTQPAFAKWLPNLPGASPEAVDHALLFGVTRALFHQPATALGAAFASCVRRWRTEHGQCHAKQTAAQAAIADAETGSAIPSPRPGSPVAPSFPPPRAERGSGSLVSPEARAELAAALRKVSVQTSPLAASSEDPTTLDLGPPATGHGPATRTPAEPPARARERRERVAGSPQAHGDRNLEPDPALEGITTTLGGAFFLVNLIQELTPPHELGRWCLLEALARALLPEPAFPNDPIWPALRELGHRLPDALPPPELAEWINPRLPPIHARLSAIAAECTQDLPGPPPFELAPLFLHRARLLITRSQVDIVFRLDQICLPIRRAGLDCDPGWLPEFGRVIRFHFQ